MKKGEAHRVPLIVGTNADEGKLFTRFMKLLPTTEHAIERLLAFAEPETRDRITAAYPGYPHPEACVQLGGDFAFGTAAWQIAEAHGAHAPTYVYRYDYAPRTLHWSGLGATHGMELLAVFDVYGPSGRRADDGHRPAPGIEGEQSGAAPLAQLQPHRRAR